MIAVAGYWLNGHYNQRTVLKETSTQVAGQTIRTECYFGPEAEAIYP